MTPIIASSPATTAVPDAIVALPGQAPVQQPATGLRSGGRDGPLRNGNPRGNPSLAPRCGAKARTTGCACQAPAMANGRCWSHGGKSTGPRTPEGLARLAAANTTHGKYAQAGLGAKLRVHIRHCRVEMRRVRLWCAADHHLRWLPRALAARVQADDVPELRAPVHYSQFQDAPVPGSPGPSAPGQALCKAGRDARGRFAAAPRRCCVGGKPSWRGRMPRRRRWPRGRRRSRGRG
jgi:hypothetical protein